MLTHKIKIIFKRINSWNIFENYCPGNLLSVMLEKLGTIPGNLRAGRTERYISKTSHPATYVTSCLVIRTYTH